jgi:aryl-alcohol dehydrogenase-like predicted oxidoreductase
MQYTNLGSSGIQVSRLCLGCMTYGSSQWRPWVLDEEASRPFFRQAWEAGINFFDTADMYSDGASEVVLGRALRELAMPREQVVVATKVFNPMGPTANERGLSRKHIRHAIDASLKRLQLDYVDLYQIHRFDHTTPIAETMEALHDVVKAGKARYIGASSMYAWEFSKAQYTASANGWTRFVSMQNYYNLLYREEEREMMPLCEDLGVGMIPWSPQARGKLTRDWDEATARSSTEGLGTRAAHLDSDRDTVEEVATIAADRGVSRGQIALAWVRSHPVVSAPIVGATKIEHLNDAIAAVEIDLTADEIKQLEAYYVTRPIQGVSPLPSR